MTNSQRNEPVDFRVKIDKMLDGEGSTKAYASMTIGNAFAVHDIRITEKDNEIRVSMPFRSYTAGGKKQYSDICHPVTAEMRQAIHEAVKAAYEAELAHRMAGQQCGMMQRM